MTPCERFETRILALHLNELDALTAWRVRRHVQSCQDCAARLAAEFTLDAKLSRAALVRPAPIATSTRRRTAIRVGGLALAASVALCGAILLRPGTPGGPSLAFAEVEKALSDSKYITWTQTTVSGFPNGKPRYPTFGNTRRTESKEIYWASIRPLRLVIKSSSDRIPDSSFYAYYDADHSEGKSDENAYFWENNASSGLDSTSTIKNLVLSPIDPQYPEAKPIGVKSTATPWKAASATHNGKHATLFSRTEQWEWEQVDTTRTRLEQVWVDPINHHLLRRKSHTRFSHGFEIKSVAENFQYLDVAPNGTFDPPRPKTWEVFTFRSFSGPERKLLVEDKGVDLSIRRQIGQIVEAMNEGNGKKLVALGAAKLYASDGPEKLGGKTRAQREAYLSWYLKDVANRRVLKNWNIDRLPGHFTSVMTRWHRQEQGAAFPPTGPMEVSIPISGTATLESGKRQKIHSFFTFRLTPNGPKLIWFNPINHS